MIEIVCVMPVFNCAQIVELGIRSVMEQDRDDWKLVIVDDSTDNTPEVVKRIVGKDNRIVHIRLSQWLTVPRKRDLGVAAVGSNYVAHFDCDNYYPPGRLRVQVESLVSSPNAISSIPFTRWCNPAKHDGVGQLRGNGHPLQMNCGGTLTLSRGLWRAVGGCDSDRFPCEDMELSTKLRTFGAESLPAPSEFSERFLGVEHGKNVWSQDDRSQPPEAEIVSPSWRSYVPEWAAAIIESACGCGRKTT